MTKPPVCKFCNVSPDRNYLNGEFGFAQWDKHPVNPGHSLVIPHRHIPTYFDAEEGERNGLWDMVNEVKEIIDTKHNPDGYNIGINIGPVSGQSILHLHIHIIPRYQGDMENPQGGVRGVIPGRQKYETNV